MFTFSFNWLNFLSTSKLDYIETKKILNLQGFDIQREKKIKDDFILTIEVKSNRPDCLCIVGVLREIYAYYEKDYKLSDPITNLHSNNESFAYNINVIDTDICKRFSAIIIKNINNKDDTPDFIKKFLLSVGCNTINPSVDIINYITLTYGQPLHIYDIDKIKGGLSIKKNRSNNNVINTFDKKTININDERSIIISDDKKILVLAGIIGSNEARVDRSTKNILVECANFNKETIRYSSKIYKISTLSSFRYERGVNIKNHRFILSHIADLFIKYLHGITDENMFDYYPSPGAQNNIKLKYNYVNKILGCKLSKKTIEKNLTRYNIKYSENSNGVLDINPPDYRLDLKNEEDIIEEIARGYGYHNIKPKYPKININLNKFKKNTVNEHIKKVLFGLNFYEVINYSFISVDAMKNLNISKDSNLYNDIYIKNPISKEYGLMRNNLIYSLIKNVIFNSSKNEKNLRLFEIGKIYNKDPKYDTGFKENYNLGLIFTGTKIPKGFNIINDIKHDFYDINNYLSIIFFEIKCEYYLVKKQLPFLKENSSFLLIHDEKEIGFAGEIKSNIFKKFENGKLIRDAVYYIEFNSDVLMKKNIKFLPLQKNPFVEREYNLTSDGRITFKQISSIIKKTSDLIRKVSTKDIYIYKQEKKDKMSILINIIYFKENENIDSEEIKEIEDKFLSALKKEDIKIK